MKIDAGAMGPLDSVPQTARRLEEAGYDGILTAEMAHDPFFPLLLAAEHTEKIDLLTSIAVAFARTPMLLANIGHDLNRYSRGRFILGLGSQIKPHITKRFSMPWSKPASRMREFILAMRAIWACWDEGKPLDFRGEFYSHTLMTPMFTPDDASYGAPRVFLAAVGPMMTEVAGEVADGLIVHAFTNEKYLREVTLPALQRGLEKAGRPRDSFEISYPVFIATGRTEEEYREARTGVARQLAFYASTPAYRPVLEVHGWGDLQSEMNRLSKQGKWLEMGELVSDEVLDAFAICDEPQNVARRLKERVGDIVDRTTGGFLTSMSGDERRDTMELLRS